MAFGHLPYVTAAEVPIAHTSVRTTSSCLSKPFWGPSDWGWGSGQTLYRQIAVDHACARSLNFTSWNRMVSWLRQLEALRAVA